MTLVIVAAAITSVRYVAIVRNDFAGSTERHAIEADLVHYQARLVMTTYPTTTWLGFGPGWYTQIIPKHETYFGPFRGVPIRPRLESDHVTTGVRRTADLWLPLWIPGVAFAGSAILLGWRLHRTRPLPFQRCRCGYDLAATPAGHPCPECGAMPATS